MDKTIEYLKTLYFTLREMKKQKRENFKSSEYKWRLGAELVKELMEKDIYRLECLTEPKVLFGIVVEIDYFNPWNVQLYEDITNKIAIDVGNPITVDKLEQIENIVKQVESLHPEIAIGDREAIRKIREVLDNDTSTEKS